jgi:hypothetical protein
LLWIFSKQMLSLNNDGGKYHHQHKKATPVLLSVLCIPRELSEQQLAAFDEDTSLLLRAGYAVAKVRQVVEAYPDIATPEAVEEYLGRYSFADTEMLQLNARIFAEHIFPRARDSFDAYRSAAGLPRDVIGKSIDVGVDLRGGVYHWAAVPSMCEDGIDVHLIKRGSCSNEEEARAAAIAAAQKIITEAPNEIRFNDFTDGDPRYAYTHIRHVDREAVLIADRYARLLH